MKPRTWVGVVLCMLLVGGSYVVLDHTVLGEADDPSADLPAHPSVAGKDEPDELRVHVDNSGRRITVSVRTPDEPWSERMDVTVNGNRTVLQKGVNHGMGTCGPKVDTRPRTQITRLSFPRKCVPHAGQVEAEVSVDGGDPVSARASYSKPPNVLMLMVDDMRYDELRYMPNVKKLLAEKGVTFRNGFAPLPLCCPARASVFTGQYPHNHGVWSQSPPWGFGSMKDDSTFPVWMDRRGYRTSYIGKYLNRYGRDPAPHKEKGTSFRYVPPGWDRFRASFDGMDPSNPNFGGTHQYFNTTLTRTGKGFLSLQGRYQTNAYADLEQASLRKEAKQDDPFLHFVSFSAPHTGVPKEADDPKDLNTPARPKRVWGMFDDIITEAPGADWKDPDRSDKPDKMREELSEDEKKQVLELSRQRAESLHLVDQAVGRIIKTLERTGQLENTLITFTSDNGFFLGEQGRASGKVMPYEPSLRVPVLMRGPGVPEGEVRTDPFLSTDFAPTYADVADAEMTTSVDGRSMLDVLRLGDETAGDSWDRMVLTESVPIKAVTQRLSRKDPIGAQTTKLLRGRVTGIRTSRYLYTEWETEPWNWDPGVEVELYDIRKDPEQYDNLALDPQHEKTVAELHKVLDKARKCAGAQCRVPLPRSLR